MLELTIHLSPEGWDEEKQEFVEPTTTVLQLEHSLISLSKWESKWHKPFLHTPSMTGEETIDYVKCMTLTPDVDPDVYNHLTNEHILKVKSYIDNPMTATTFSEEPNGKKNREIVTSEIIYHWMVALQIDFQCQEWHLNRLITLIRVCNIKNAPPKKRSKKDIMRNNAALNAARKKQLNTTG